MLSLFIRGWLSKYIIDIFGYRHVFVWELQSISISLEIWQCQLIILEYTIPLKILHCTSNPAQWFRCNTGICCYMSLRSLSPEIPSLLQKYPVSPVPRNTFVTFFRLFKTNIWFWISVVPSLWTVPREKWPQWPKAWLRCGVSSPKRNEILYRSG